MKEVLLTGDKMLVHVRLDLEGFILFFARGEKLWGLSSLPPTASPVLENNPDGSTRTDGLSALVSFWEEDKMRSETLQSG